MSNNIAFSRTRSYNSRPPFLVDEDAVVIDTGHQIAWEYLDSRYSHDPVVIEVTADADIDDTTLTVVALTRAIAQGEVLDFGLRPAITVTLSGNEAIGQTAIGVTALTAPIRSGAILYSGAGEFMKLTADAAIGDVSLTVEALEVAWESADTATLPAQRIFARVTDTAAEIGDTSITVEALDGWINDGDVAYLGTGLSGRQVKPGTWMCELADGRIVPRAVRPGSETAKYLLATFANEESPTDAATGYGVIAAASVYENLLPEASGSPKVSPSGYVTEARANGGYWMMSQYSDNTNS